MIGIGINTTLRVISGGGGPSYDVDAQAFFDRVTTAGGTLTTTEKNATNQLVLDMKSAGIWTAMKAVYPMVGASAAACAQNLKSSSFTGTFSSGWTFASTGVTPNGTSAYMNTGLNANTNQTVNNCAVSVYLRSSNVTATIDIGCANSPTYLPLISMEGTGTGRNQYAWDYNTAIASITTTDSRGMWGVSRTGTATWQSFERNTAVAKTTTTAQTTLPNLNIYVGSTNINTGASAFSNREVAFAQIGDGLTNTQFNNLYTAVQTFQTTLSRQV